MNFFANKNILITGAAHGVGKAITLRLKDSAANLILLDKDLDALNDLLSKETFSVPIHLWKADLAVVSDLENIVREILGKVSSIDIFINNAGVSVIAPIEAQSIDDVNWIVNINLVSAMELTRLIIPGMKKKRSGYLAFVGSAAGIQGFPNKTTYCASKFGLRGFAESLETEVAPFGISVSCVFPGPIKTNMLSRSIIADSNLKNRINSYLQNKGDSPDQVASKILKGIQKKKSIVLVSGQSRTLWFFKRVIPIYFTKLITRFQDKLPA